MLGVTCKMDEIKQIAKNKIKILEDNCSQWEQNIKINY